MRNDSLYQEVCSLSNLREAWHQVSLGKADKLRFLEMELYKDEILVYIRDMLLSHTYKPLPVTYSTIYEPKKREIAEPHDIDKIVHHALIQVTLPYFAGRYHPYSYACIRGRGPLECAKHYSHLVRRAYGRWSNDFYVVSIDFRKFFQSIDKEIVKLSLRSIFSPTYHSDTLYLFDAIIDGYERDGLPLGYLTSQHEANLLVTALDYYITDTLGYSCYVRYMDDERILVHTRKEAKTLLYKIDSYCCNKLHLALSEKKTTTRQWRSADIFCGYEVHPHYLKRNKMTIERGERRTLKKERLYLEGKLPLEAVLDSAQQLNSLYTGTVEMSNALADEIIAKYRAL